MVSPTKNVHYTHLTLLLKEQGLLLKTERER